MVIAGLCLFSIAGLLCVIDLSKLQRDAHRSLLEQSTYLVTHYYLIRLPVSLMLIAVCILTPFAISWKLPMDYTKTNNSYSQNKINQVIRF